MLLANDLSPNMKLWKININSASFKHPAHPNREIFVIVDALHLIKLIRNNFMDHDCNFVNITCGCVHDLIISKSKKHVC